MERRKNKSGSNASEILIKVSALILVSVVFLGGCSSEENTAANTANKKRANSNSQNSAPPVNGETVATTDPNSANAQPVNAPDRLNEKIEKLRATAANSANTGKTSSVKGPPSRPAPEDSTIKAELTDVARETRTFRSHPQILKVEKIHDGKEGAVKVYLRDGRVFDLSGKSIPSLERETTARILQLVGLAPTPQRPSGGKEKKPGN